MTSVADHVPMALAQDAKLIIIIIVAAVLGMGPAAAQLSADGEIIAIGGREVNRHLEYVGDDVRGQ